MEHMILCEQHELLRNGFIILLSPRKAFPFSAKADLRERCFVHGTRRMILGEAMTTTEIFTRSETHTRIVAAERSDRQGLRPGIVGRMDIFRLV